MLSSNFNLFPPEEKSDVSLRPLEEKDFQALATLCLQTFKETYPEQFTTDELAELFGDKYVNIQLPTELKNKNITYIVAATNSRLIGYAKLEYDQNTVTLDKAYLQKAYQGKGHGKSLLIKCCEDAVNRNINQMKLNVWIENKTAITFYEKCGLQKQDTIEKQFGTKTFKDIVMIEPDIKALLARLIPKTLAIFDERNALGI